MSSFGSSSPRKRRAAVVAATALGLLVPLAGPAVAAPAPAAAPAAAPAGAPAQAGFAIDPASVVMVHGVTLADAQAAVASSGLTTVESYDKIGVVVAAGTPAQIEAAGAADGVTQIEANVPIEFFTETSNNATRGAEARDRIRGANGRPLDGSGVTVAVIDSGIDPTHPSFDGGKVVRNLKAACLLDGIQGRSCLVDVGNLVDTDTTAVGGHGTHVSGIAAGNVATLAGGHEVSGAAPGAKIVSIGTGAVLFIIGANSGLNWVLDNHANPCAGCPPIKVTNNSYGPSGGGDFNPESATAKLQRALAREGVVTVWAAGNDGGSGREAVTNPPGRDQTPGIISAASYFDRDTGTRDGDLSDFSSRGLFTDPTTWPDIAAPGEDITAACRPYLPICSTGLDFKNGPGSTDIGTFNTISGTSMAAPHIAGIVAQLFQAAPKATPAQVEDALKSTAYRFNNGIDYRQVGPYRTSFDKGTGLVDVVAATQKLVRVAPR